MKVTDRDPPPWGQAARLVAGPPGVPEIDRDSDLEGCVRWALAYDRHASPPPILEIHLENFEIVDREQIYALAKLLPEDEYPEQVD